MQFDAAILDLPARLDGDLLIDGQQRRGTDPAFNAIDARLGIPLAPAYGGASDEDIDDACRCAGEAFDAFRQTRLAQRADLLESIATGIDASAAVIVERASLETGLPAPRVDNERQRTTFQLRLFAALVRQGDWLDARIDRALPARRPLPRPDLRLQRLPLGPVAVFGASNFPLAFSVAGGDTAAAIAAGAPVVVKAHPAHPGTSELVGRIVQQCVRSAGLPGGVFSLLFGSGHHIGTALVANPHIKAVGFTGSRSGGQALMQVAATRPVPIPVYAEMSSINPVFLLPDALRLRAGSIAGEFVASMSLSAGQFCTSPGLLIAVDNPDLNEFLEATGSAMAAVAAQTMLTSGIHAAFLQGVSHLGEQDGVTLVATGSSSRSQADTTGTTHRFGGDAAASEAAASTTTPAINQCRAQLYSVSADRFLANPALTDEVFGACSLVVRCHSGEQMQQIARKLEGQLTATLHLADGDLPLARPLFALLETRAGRIVCNGFPTGVEVCDAMVHGGPWPATSDGRSTSVGTAAIERFLRPVCYQDVPEALMPDAVKPGNPLGLNRMED